LGPPSLQCVPWFFPRGKLAEA